MTGRINYTPEAEQQLSELDDRITKAASAEIAQRFVSVLLDHVDGILPARPPAERATTSARACGRPSSRGRPSAVDETSDELVVNILGLFHGGQDWEAALGADTDDSQAGE